jgi:hypothetical protein
VTKDVGHGKTCAEHIGERLDVAAVAPGYLKGQSNKQINIVRRPLDLSSSYDIIHQHAGLDFETGFVRKRNSWELRIEDLSFEDCYADKDEHGKLVVDESC